MKTQKTLERKAGRDGRLGTDRLSPFMTDGQEFGSVFQLFCTGMFLISQGYRFVGGDDLTGALHELQLQ